MHFTVSKVHSTPKFDSLEVAKIVHYPFEKRAYKPYAQARLAISETLLYIQMWAFEAQPEAGSKIVAEMNLPLAAGGKLNLLYETTANGEESFLLGGHPVAKAAYQRAALAGEDLQGVFWGISAEIPLQLLYNAGAKVLQKDDVFEGNFYKICTGARPHYGSYCAPLQPDEPEYKTFATFKIIEY